MKKEVADLISLVVGGAGVSEGSDGLEEWGLGELQLWLGNLDELELLGSWLGVASGDGLLDLLLDGVHLLGDLSVGLDDLGDLLDDWSGDGVRSNVGFVLGAGLLVGAWLGLVDGLKAQWGGLGSHGEAEWLSGSGDVDGQRSGGGVGGGHIEEVEGSLRLDGTGDDTAVVGGGIGGWGSQGDGSEAIAEVGGTVGGLAVAAIAGWVSAGRGQDGSEDDELKGDEKVKVSQKLKNLKIFEVLLEASLRRIGWIVVVSS